MQSSLSFPPISPDEYPGICRGSGIRTAPVAIVGVALGVVALLASCVTGLCSAPFGVAAMVCGVIAYRFPDSTNRTLGLIALVLGGLAIVVPFVIGALVFLLSVAFGASS